MLLDDPALAERLGRGAREFAVEHLSWPRNAAALADFYRRRLSARVAAVA
jgi:glycosyltransferase involved in cell wall biosynthesis